MPNLIKKVTSQDGEVKVTIELTINLNTNGISINSSSEPTIEAASVKEEKPNWEIPSFRGNNKFITKPKEENK